MQPLLEIYVEPGCSNCAYAREMAAWVRGEFPEVRVSLIDLSDGQGLRPADVFAVPTYQLNGRTISLGNPSAETLSEVLRVALDRL